LSATLDAADISVERRLTDVQIMGDQGRLHEVIVNLLTNAVKFTPAGGRVLVETGAGREPAVLRICDTGQGIPPDELPRISSGLPRPGCLRGRGSGIGLAVVSPSWSTPTMAIWR